MAENDKPEHISVKFLKDEPSETDFFGSHSKVAAAVSDVICEDNEINVVGLLGSWGSGKSTVVSQIQKQLGERTSNTHFFNFDAWLYQNDPPRRSFLEALIQDLSQNELSTDHEWDSRLADLSGRSEETVTETSRRFSPTGKWIFGSLGLLPIGTVVLGRALDSNNLNQAPWMFWVGGGLTLAPLMMAFTFYLCWRPWRTILNGHFKWKEFFFRHRAPHENESILALLTNQSVERTDKKTKISPEPSVTEFRTVFRELLKTLRRKRERLIIVIDNLDRLAEAEAVELWATIRSLFLGGELRRFSKSEIASPTIILPIDEGSIRRMFIASGHREDANDLAQSFMEKTFDVAFHVNDPVMSDWRAFFRDKLIAAFSSAATEERIYWSTKFVEDFFSHRSSNRRITPRFLIKIVNSVGVLIKQWNDQSVDFLSLVFYVLHRSQISENPREFVKENRTGISAAVADWQRDIVALNYGVTRDKSFQILLEEPLRLAISQKDADEFSKLAEVVGFGPVFEDVIGSLPTIADTSSPQADFVANAAILAANSTLASEQWVKNSLPKLASAWCASSPLEAFRDDFSDVLFALAPHSDPNEFIRSSCTKLALSLPPSGLNDTSKKSFLTALSGLHRLSNEFGLTTPTLQTSLDIKPLLNLSEAVPPDLIHLIRSDKSSKEIINAVSSYLSDEKLSSEVPSYIRVLSSENTINFKDRLKIVWDDIVATSHNNIVNYPASFHSLGPSIDVIGLLHDRNANAKTNVQQLFDQGYLNTRLCEADQGGDGSTLADVAALMFLRGTDFAAPNGKSWSQIVKDHDDFVRNFTMALTWYLRVNPTASAHRAIKSHPSLKPIIVEMVKRDIHQGAKGLPTSHIVRNIKQLEALAGADALTLALEHAAKRPDFWSTVDGLEDAVSYETVAETLLRTGVVERSILAKNIRDRISSRDASSWKHAIFEGDTFFSLINFYGEELQQKDTLGESLKSSLQDAVADILSSDEDVRQRWFYLNRFVSKNAKVTSLRNLRDFLQSGSPVKNLIGLMKIGGPELINQGKFIDFPDKTTRHVTIPLLGDDAGLDYLSDNMDIFSRCFHESDEETKQTALETLAAVRISTDEDAPASLSVVEKGFAVRRND